MDRQRKAIRFIEGGLCLQDTVVRIYADGNWEELTRKQVEKGRSPPS